MARLVLVGLPGAGKSTTARALAQRWNCEVIDTDEWFAQRTGISVADYLRREGEEKFRLEELATLSEALRSDAVVATGGGVVTTAPARELLREHPTVWLDADVATLLERVALGDRPLLGEHPQERLEQLRGDRSSWYESVALVRIDATGSLDEVTELVEHWSRSRVRVIPVSLERRSYNVIVGPGVRHQLAELVATLTPRAQAAVIITTAEIAAQPWFDIDAGISTFIVEVPNGESAKTFSALEYLCESLASVGLSRHDVVVGVGGGAVTDIAGLVAAVYLRGLSVIHVPTSLVGQVDAAIGGKTALNLAAGKNLVGAFHQPTAVICDTETLATLPLREWRSGYGEVAKCALLENVSAPEVAQRRLDDLVTMCVSLKARIVSSDEFEGGQRALLNYGHTLGHAIEAIALERNTDELRHGEAVAIGLAFAVRLARNLGKCSDDEVRHVDDVVHHFDLSTTLSRTFAPDEIMEKMGRDKKAHHDLTFVLPGADGFEVVSGVSPDVVRRTIEEFQGEQ